MAPTNDLIPTLISLEVAIKPDDKQQFIVWQADFNKAIGMQEGFISLEFIAPQGESMRWLITQRFSTEQTATLWRTSQQHSSLLERLHAMALPNTLREHSVAETSISQRVTEVFVTETTGKDEKAYLEWSAKIHQIEATFPGFLGVYVQSHPIEGKKSKGKRWITLLQFDTVDHLDSWLQSEERKQVLEESTKLIASLDTHRVISPYAGWFSSLSKGAVAPPAWKQTMIVLLVLFPIIILEIKYLNPITRSLNPSLATFIGNAISVVLISYPGVPIAVAGLKWWLLLQKGQSPFLEALGLTVMLLLYGLELTLFWNFL